MSGDTISVTFECKSCGGTVLSLPDNPTDDSRATCKSCGADVGRWGDIQAAAQQAGIDHIHGELRGIFEGMKGWTVKKD
jgi:hypothetical protein